MNFFCVGVVLLFSASSIDGQYVVFNHPATQSSNWPVHASGADRAVDGDTGRSFFQDTCSHTDCLDPAPTWTVEFDNVYDVESVVIFSPNEAYSRMKSIQVDVYETDPALPGAVPQFCFSIDYYGVPDGTRIDRACPPGVSGRFLRIYKTYVNFAQQCDALLLCEVQVRGTAVVAAGDYCGLGFVQNGHDCYYFSSLGTTGSWSDAQVFCESINSYLVVIDTAAEDDFLRTSLNGAHAATGYWTGATDILDQGNFRWTSILPNRPLTYTNWDAGQPSNDHNTERCVELRFGLGFQWNDASCRNHKGFICEMNHAT